ncbi:MAG: heavy-metal-associated domain-containing protein [Betaproteobacteria bacterium]|nr:heavy-metal-associated domain-containing protein [Betaproteobacteria bacterium]
MKSSLRGYIASTFILGGILLSSIALADQIKVNVNGMVCGFCAQGIKKKLEKTGLVDKIKVDLESKIVSFSTLPGKEFNDEAITKLITDAGYTVVKITKEKP